MASAKRFLVSAGLRLFFFKRLVNASTAGRNFAFSSSDIKFKSDRGKEPNRGILKINKIFVKVIKFARISIKIFHLVVLTFFNLSAKK